MAFFRLPSPTRFVQDKLKARGTHTPTHWDQAPYWGKEEEKQGETAKIGERSEPSDGLGRGRAAPPFSLPRLPLSSFRSPIFFPPFPPLRSYFFVLENEPIPNMCEQMVLQEYVLQ